MAGTPPRPATGTVSGAPARTGARGIPPVPRRVSMIRAGGTPLKRPPDAAGSEASVNQPLTSTTTSTLPPPLKMLTWPFVPTPTITRLGTVWPAVKLTLEVRGQPPAGKSVTQPATLGLVAVTFRATAATPVDGTPPRLSTVKPIVCPGPIVVEPPSPVRVSSSRLGTSGRYSPAGALSFPVIDVHPGTPSTTSGEPLALKELSAPVRCAG